MEQKELFEKLLQTNVNEFTEKKGNLTYLSWANAWEELLKVVPDATYRVRMFTDKNGLQVPYCGNGEIGYMVFVELTVNGLSRECYLPVMDNKNQTVKEPNMFEINKTIQRCLAKAISLFGLGLYIYQGEDLPTEIENPITPEQIKKMSEIGVNIANTLRYYKVNKIEDLTENQANVVITMKEKSIEKPKAEKKETKEIKDEN